MQVWSGWWYSLVFHQCKDWRVEGEGERTQNDSKKDKRERERVEFRWRTRLYNVVAPSSNDSSSFSNRALAMRDVCIESMWLRVLFFRSLRWKAKGFVAMTEMQRKHWSFRRSSSFLLINKKKKKKRNIWSSMNYQADGKKHGETCGKIWTVCSFSELFLHGKNTRNRLERGRRNE